MLTLIQPQAKTLHDTTDAATTVESLAHELQQVVAKLNTWEQQFPSSVIAHDDQDGDAKRQTYSSMAT
jgi:hypothetical protein